LAGSKCRQGNRGGSKSVTVLLLSNTRRRRETGRACWKGQRKPQTYNQEGRSLHVCCVSEKGKNQQVNCGKKPKGRPIKGKDEEDRGGKGLSGWGGQRSERGLRDFGGWFASHPETTDENGPTGLAWDGGSGVVCAGDRKICHT